MRCCGTERANQRALEKAREAISAVEAKTASYEERVRKAKRRYLRRASRGEAVECGARRGCGAGPWGDCGEVNAAKAEIEQSVAVARQQIEG